VDCRGREERKVVKQKKKERKVAKAKQTTSKKPTFIEALRAAFKPAQKKSKKRNQVYSGRANSGRMSCRDFGLL